MRYRIDTKKAQGIPIHVVPTQDWKHTIRSLSQAHQAWIKTQNIAGNPGDLCYLPKENGTIALVLWVYDPYFWSGANVMQQLPQNTYYLTSCPQLKINNFFFS